MGPALNPTMRAHLLRVVLRPAEYHRVAHGPFASASGIRALNMSPVTWMVKPNSRGLSP